MDLRDPSQRGFFAMHSVACSLPNQLPAVRCHAHQERPVCRLGFRGLDFFTTGRIQRAFFLALTGLGLTCFSTPAIADGTKYFLNNQPGSNCNDRGPHTEANPWCSFAPVNELRVFSPGDQILLARGATWHQGLVLSGSGSALQPITLAAYGTGPHPRILRYQATDEICVLLTNVSN